MKTRPLLAGLALTLALAPARAQPAGADLPLRDPMQPPAAAALAASAASGVPAVPDHVVPRQILVIEGRRFLVDGGRRLAVGDRMGSERIERIGTDAVWLRDDLTRTLQRVPLYPGVLRRTVAEPGAVAASAPGSPSSRPVPQRSPKKESP